MSVSLLVAEDEDVIRNGIVKYIKLHTDRFDRIYEAENGQQAEELLLKHHPDMMLLDVQMPVKTGIDVMKDADAAGIHPVTIILSGYDEFKYAQQAIKFGAKEYLLKPVRAADILTKLNEYANEYVENEQPVEQKETTTDKPVIKKAKAYIEEHYAENISLTDLADELGLSGGYLSTIFNQNMGYGFIDYLNMVRIERACSYLEQNYLKNYEIAYKVGFRDDKYFSKVFKKLKGMSPKEYRIKNS